MAKNVVIAILAAVVLVLVFLPSKKPAPIAIGTTKEDLLQKQAEVIDSLVKVKQQEVTKIEYEIKKIRDSVPYWDTVFRSYPVASLDSAFRQRYNY